jgi:hypothetical protein
MKINSLKFLTDENVSPNSPYPGILPQGERQPADEKQRGR